MSSQVSSSLVLGTAQLGLPYGVANKTGQPNHAMVLEIIRIAWENGIREFDTAQDYGISEDVLGSALSTFGISKEVKVISKIDPELEHRDIKVMTGALDKSLEKLHVSSLFGLMLHKEELLYQWQNGLRDILRTFVASGKVRHLGVSVYSPDKALEALRVKEIDIIQVPSNMLDRRFEKAGVFKLAAEKNKQIYIRSVFLQGLILMDSKELPNNMSFARPVIEKIDTLSNRLNLTKHELALGYLKASLPDAKLVIGVDTPEQIMENIKSWKRGPAANLIPLVCEYFDQLDEKILNPTLWRN